MKMFLYTSFALLFACGASTDNPPENEMADGGQLGSAEQAMSAKTTPSFQYGARDTSSFLQCDKTSSGQVCHIPSTKNILYCASAPSPFASDLVGPFNLLDARTGWTFTVGSSIFKACNLENSPNIDVQVQSDGCGANGTASNVVSDYVCITRSGSTGLSEGGTVVGNYIKDSSCVVKIDVTQIQAKGTSDANDRRLFRHALAHGVFACAGIGARTGVTGRGDATTMNQTIEQNTLSSGQTCMLDSYNTSTPGSFDNVGTCGSD